jgi:MFS family permease
VGGSLIALSFLGIFAAANWYPMALVALVMAGLGASGFSTMQSALVMTSAADEVRGRALGLLSMCIGILPFGMLTLGGAAEAMGPTAGVISGVLLGVVLMLIWTLRSPESQRVP